MASHFTVEVEAETNTYVLRVQNCEEAKEPLIAWCGEFVTKTKQCPIDAFMNRSGRVVRQEGATLKAEQLREAFNAHTGSKLDSTRFGCLMTKYVNSPSNIYGIAKRKGGSCVVYDGIWLEGLPLPIKKERARTIVVVPPVVPVS